MSTACGWAYRRHSTQAIVSGRESTLRYDWEMLHRRWRHEMAKLLSDLVGVPISLGAISAAEPPPVKVRHGRVVPRLNYTIIPTSSRRD